MKLLAISPHIDDAIYSLGQTIADTDTTVLTVLAGLPPADGTITPYDEMCGFKTSSQAVTRRRIENENACDSLAVNHVEGDWLDGQYGPTIDLREMTRWMSGQMAGYDHVLCPVGIGHPDHALVAAVALTAAFAVGARVGVYLEIPSYVRQPVEAMATFNSLTSGWTVTPAELPVRPRSRKRAAVECYASQLGPDMRAHVYAPEHVWWIDR